MAINFNPTNITFNDSTVQMYAAASGATKYMIATNPITWTNPLASTSSVAYGSLKGIRVTLIGGGGGGSGSRHANTTPSIGGLGWWGSFGVPGGAGGFNVQYIPAIPGTPVQLPSAPITITIGGGGTNGAPNGGSGGTGGTSSFGSLFTATGGAGGVTSPLSDCYLGVIGAGGTNGGLPIIGAGGTSVAPGWVVNWYGAIGEYGPINGGVGLDGVGYGMAGGGGVTAPYPVSPSPNTVGYAGGYGTGGLCIVEEFY